MKAIYIPTRPILTPQEKDRLKSAVDALKTLSGAFMPENQNPQALVDQMLDLRPCVADAIGVILEALALGVEPEVLAACLARYSRSNEGIASILERFSDKNPDAIFQFVDYGHASIGGLTGGIAIAIDGVSMLLAYKLFEFAQMADGQESSTRYIELNESGLPCPSQIGIPEQLHSLWNTTCLEGFRLYKFAYDALNQQVERNPECARIPEQAKPKARDRMLKNYALDRARYFLPLACKTNLAIVATARIWADTIRLLESLQWPEAIEAAELIRTQLNRVAPNLVRHSFADNASIGFVQELQHAGQRHAACGIGYGVFRDHCDCRVEVFDPSLAFNKVDFSTEKALGTRVSRYSHTGTMFKRQTVQAEWSAIAVAELRDLNRHRTGFRFSDFAPAGFYIPTETKEMLFVNSDRDETSAFRASYESLVRSLARTGQPGLHSYGYFLGTQVAFEHTQQADKFLYEVELRTGLGAHFRYAEHLRQAAELYFEKHPDVRRYVPLGNAEPE